MVLHVRIMAVACTERPEDTYGVLEHDSLGIALADAFGFDTVGAYWLLLTALDAALATC
jgi:hypothetical protein